MTTEQQIRFWNKFCLLLSHVMLRAVQARKWGQTEKFLNFLVSSFLSGKKFSCWLCFWDNID
jgi:hypothetical protein